MSKSDKDGILFPEYDEEDLLDWDAHIDTPPPRKSGTIRVKLKYLGRSEPIPVYPNKRRVMDYTEIYGKKISHQRFEDIEKNMPEKAYVHYPHNYTHRHTLIGVKRIDKSLPLPIHETEGSVGVDLICRTETTVGAGQIMLIPTNIIVLTPPGYMFVVLPRSSMFRKTGLTMPHSMGIIDNDYCGEDDEVMLQVYNGSKHAITILRGDKIAQGLLLQVERIVWAEIDEVPTESRGGFGSTEKKENENNE